MKAISNCEASFMRPITCSTNQSSYDSNAHQFNHRTNSNLCHPIPIPNAANPQLHKPRNTLPSKHILTPIPRTIALTKMNRPQLQVSPLAAGIAPQTRATSSLQQQLIEILSRHSLRRWLDGRRCGRRFDERRGGVRSAGCGGEREEGVRCVLSCLFSCGDEALLAAGSEGGKLGIGWGRHFDFEIGESALKWFG